MRCIYVHLNFDAGLPLVAVEVGREKELEVKTVYCLSS